MPKSRIETENKIKETLGFVPEFYRSLPDAALAGAWSLQHDLELDDTALEHKTKELIGLAMASHIKCKYCIYFHTRAAQLFGATEEEAREAIAMGGSTVLFSNNITGTQTDFDKFKRDIDRLMEEMAGRMKK